METTFEVRLDGRDDLRVAEAVGGDLPETARVSSSRERWASRMHSPTAACSSAMR